MTPFFGRGAWVAMDGRAARERLERARREWLVAYRERERVVLEELARTEDSHIEEAIHGMRLPLQRPFVDPPATPSLSRSRSRERRGEARRRRRRAGADAPRRPPRVRRANSPGADLPAPGAAHSWAGGARPRGPGHDGEVGLARSAAVAFAAPP